MTVPVIADKELIRKCQTAVGSAGLALIHCAPYLGLAWPRMKPLAHVPAQTQGGTWEVNAKGELFCDAAFTLGMTPEECVFVLGHEIFHVLMEHFERAVALGLITPDGKAVPGKERELEAWGQACDMSINPLLRDNRIGKPPAGVLFPPAEYIATGGPIAAEPIYYWLLKNPQHAPPPPPNGPDGKPGKPGPGQGCMPLPPPPGGQGQQPDPNGPPAPPQPGNGPPQPGKAPAPPAPPAPPVDWKQVRREVEAFARQAGLGSGIAEALKPRPARSNLRAILKPGFEHVSAEAEERSLPSFSRLSRRPDSDPSGIIRPGRIGTDGTIAVVIDVSGSVSRGLVAKAAGVCLSLCAEFPTVRVIFVTHTDKVCWSGVLKAGGDAKAIAEATANSGGTCARPAYVRVGELAGTPARPGKVDSMIHFTDCELFEEVWPEAPAKQLVIAECGEAATREAGTPRPPRARRIPVLE